MPRDVCVSDSVLAAADATTIGERVADPAPRGLRGSDDRGDLCAHERRHDIATTLAHLEVDLGQP